MRRMWSKNQLENKIKQGAEEVIESGLVENAKPIYFHPIYIAITDAVNSRYFRISGAILNNDATPFTLTSFKEWIDKLDVDTEGAGQFNCSGAVTESGVTLIISHLKKLNNVYYITGINASTGANANLQNVNFNTLFADATLTDGVNKIN